MRLVHLPFPPQPDVKQSGKYIDNQLVRSTTKNQKQQEYKKNNDQKKSKQAAKKQI